MARSTAVARLMRCSGWLSGAAAAAVAVTSKGGPVSIEAVATAHARVTGGLFNFGTVELRQRVVMAPAQDALQVNGVAGAIDRLVGVDVADAGNLVEESAERNAVPGFGDDCYPLEWPATLDLLASMLGDGSVVVPGHGPLSNRAELAAYRLANPDVHYEN